MIPKTAHTGWRRRVNYSGEWARHGHTQLYMKEVDTSSDFFFSFLTQSSFVQFIVVHAILSKCKDRFGRNNCERA